MGVEPKHFEATESSIPNKSLTHATTGTMELHRVARVHGVNPKELEVAWMEFERLSQNTYEIPRDQFGVRLAESLGLPLSALPAHFRSHGHTTTPQKPILFEEFMVWHKAHEFDPLLVEDPQKRLLTALSQQHDIEVKHVEDFHKIFCRFAGDDLEIGYEAFAIMMPDVMHCSAEDLSHQKLEHFFKE